jgi:hypothetical protein
MLKSLNYHSRSFRGHNNFYSKSMLLGDRCIVIVSVFFQQRSEKVDIVLACVLEGKRKLLILCFSLRLCLVCFALASWWNFDRIGELNRDILYVPGIRGGRRSRRWGWRPCLSSRGHGEMGTRADSPSLAHLHFSPTKILAKCVSCQWEHC